MKNQKQYISDTRFTIIYLYNILAHIEQIYKNENIKMM